MADRRKRRVRVVVAVMALVAPLLVPTAAQAAVDEGIAAHGRFAKDGVTYRFGMQVADDHVVMTVWRVRNPDGPGGLWSRQEHTYQFWTDHDPLTVTSTDAHVDTRDALAPWGRVRMAFIPREEPQRDGRCDPYETQRGRLQGVLRLRTHSRFGAIEITRMPANLTRYVGAADDCPPPPPPPPVAPVPQCPSPSRSLRIAHPGWAYTHAQRPYRGRVAASTWRESTLQMRNARTDGLVEREITVRLNRDRLRFSRDLSTAVLAGAPGIDLRGWSRFAATTPLRRSVEQCSFTEEAVVRARRGTLSGNLRFDYFIGRDRDLSGRTWRTQVRHTRNRDAR